MSFRLVLVVLVACSGGNEPEGHGHEHGGDEEGHAGHDHGAHEEGGHEPSDGEPGHEELRLSPAAILASGIVVAPVERRALTGRAGWPAELRFDPQSTGHVTLPAPGRIVSVDAELGQQVEQGDTLGFATSAAASGVAADRNRLRARLSVAEAALERHQQLATEGIGAARAVIESESEVAALRAELRGLSAQARVLGAAGGRLLLRAPIDGVVVHVGVTRGETIGINEVVFTVADPRAFSVYGEIPEISIGDVRQGLGVVFRPHAFRDVALPGSITYVAPALSQETRSLLVRVRLGEIDRRLRSGMYGTLEFVGDDDRVLAVPTTSVVTLQGAPTVFVPGHEEGLFEPRPVQLGRRGGRFYELLSGLDEGEHIVVAGAFTLKGAMSTEGLSEHEH